MTCNSQVRVRYCETDQGGIAHHSNYMAWFEIARTDYLRKLGYSYKRMEDEGIRFVVVNLEVQFKWPAYYDDELTVAATVSRKKRLKLTFSYKVTCGGKTLATANTVMGCVDTGGRPTKIPEKILNSIAT
jgi:acyl-CoA thioester hydrolase